MTTNGSRLGVDYVRGEVFTPPVNERTCETVEELLELRSRSERPVAADLFCGAGGLSLGLQKAGFDVIVGVDIDDYALKTHAANMAGLHLNWDLADPLKVEKLADLLLQLDVTLIAGGPPCQPFSKAGRSMIRELVRSGRRPPKDVRRDMWQSFLSVVETVRPPAVLIENVPDMVLDRDMLILRTIVDELEGLGYGVDAEILESLEYGVPQFRQRVILVALAEGARFRWPHDTWASAEPVDRPVIVTLRAAIDDLPEVEPGWRGSALSEYKGPISEFQKAMRANVDPAASHRVDDHVTRAVRPDDYEAFELLDAGMRYSDLPEELKRYRDDIFDDKYKRLDWDKPSRTITAHIAKDGYWYIHPEHHRTLTIREAARIQTFPDDVRFAGPPTAALAQIGNAVPPELGRHLGEALLESLASPVTRSWQTQEVSAVLADWWSRPRQLVIPWLAAPNRWTALQAEFLLNRARKKDALNAWQYIRTLTTPAATLEGSRDLEFVLAGMQRQDRHERLIEIAEHMVLRPVDLNTREGMRRARVPSAVMDVVLRIHPVANEDPIVANSGLLRMAAYFNQSDVHRSNKRSDGRVEVARLVGVEPPEIDAPEAASEPVAGPAHLALFELSESVCRPETQDHDNCPLSPWCAKASELHPQGVPRLPYEPYG
jgi:DNA (cytosine-5)-methyltransferase 1